MATDENIDEILRNCVGPTLFLNENRLTSSSISPIVSWLRQDEKREVMIPLYCMWFHDFVMALKQVDGISLFPDRIRISDDKEEIERAHRAMKKALEGNYLSFEEEFPWASTARSEKLLQLRFNLEAQLTSSVKQHREEMQKMEKKHREEVQKIDEQHRKAIAKIDQEVKHLHAYNLRRNQAVEKLFHDFLREQIMATGVHDDEITSKHSFQLWSLDNEGQKFAEFDGLFLLGDPIVDLVLLVEAKMRLTDNELQDSLKKPNQFKEYMNQLSCRSPEAIEKHNKLKRKYLEPAAFLSKFVKDNTPVLLVIASPEMTQAQAQEICSKGAIAVWPKAGAYEFANGPTQFQERLKLLRTPDTCAVPGEDGRAVASGHPSIYE